MLVFVFYFNSPRLDDTTDILRRVLDSNSKRSNLDIRALGSSRTDNELVSRSIDRKQDNPPMDMDKEAEARKIERRQAPYIKKEHLTPRSSRNQMDLGEPKSKPPVHSRQLHPMERTTPRKPTKRPHSKPLSIEDEPSTQPPNVQNTGTLSSQKSNPSEETELQSRLSLDTVMANQKEKASNVPQIQVSDSAQLNPASLARTGGEPQQSVEDLTKGSSSLSKPSRSGSAQGDSSPSSSHDTKAGLLRAERKPSTGSISQDRLQKRLLIDDLE